MRRWLWPAVLILITITVAGSMVLLRVDPVAKVLVPVVVAVLSWWLSQRLPQVRRPVVTTVRLNDIDYLEVDRSRVPASGYTVRITIEATGILAVLLEGLDVIVVGRRTPPEGSLNPHAGAVEPRPFDLLLDDPEPRVRATGSNSGDTTDFPFKVSSSDPEVFDITVRTESSDVEWFLDLRTICLGRRQSTRIDLAGRPFRTVARPKAALEGAETDG